MHDRATRTIQSCSIDQPSQEAIRAAIGAACREPATLDAVSAAILRLLPAPVFQTLLTLRGFGSSGSLRVSGFPVDVDLPSTPTTVTPELLERVPVAKSVLLGATRLLGEPFGYRGEWDGQIISHVLPSQRGVDTSSSQGSRVELLFHTENVHVLPFSPDYVALLCLRADPDDQARTTLVHARDVVDRLDDEALDLLRLPVYHVPPPLSFGGRGVGTGPFPVLRGTSAHPQLTVDLGQTTALTTTADQALRRLRQACTEVAIEVDLVPGDLLLIDNRRVLHGRTRFEPRLDGSDRWFLRTMIRSGDLWDWRVYVEDQCLMF